MSHGLRVGRLAGVQILVDWSWIPLILFGVPLLVFLLESYFFPSWETGMAGLVAVAMLVLAFGSVLVHQLAHVLAANLESIKTSRMIVYPFGGVSDVDLEPISPESDARIAAAGPIASAALGSLLLVAIAALNGSVLLAFVVAQDADPIEFLLLWAAAVNLFLALFNLLPGAPLDGGLVMRALLWARRDDFRSAQHSARALGTGLGWLVLVSALLVALDPEFDPLLRVLIVPALALLGWSVKDGAMRSIPKDRDTPLTGAHIRDFALSDTPEVSLNLTVDQLVHKYVFGTTNRVFVIRRGEILEGVLWLEDLWNVPQEQWKRVLVKHIMTPPEHLVVLKPADSAGNILQVLTDRHNRPLPVIDNGRFVGMLYRRNVDAWLRSRQRERQDELYGGHARRILRHVSRFKTFFR